MLFLSSEDRGAVRGRNTSASVACPSDIFKMNLIAVVAGFLSCCCWFFRWCGPGLRTFRLRNNFLRASQVGSVDSSSCGPGKFFPLSFSCLFSFATCTPLNRSYGAGSSPEQFTRDHFGEREGLSSFRVVVAIHGHAKT